MLTIQQLRKNCMTKDGREKLLKQPEILKNWLTKENTKQFAKAILSNNKINLSPCYLLLATTDGRKKLENYLKEFSYDNINMSPLYHLCKNINGRKVLLKFPIILEILLTKENSKQFIKAILTKDSKNLTAFDYLSADSNGKEILRAHSEIKKLLFAEENAEQVIKTTVPNMLRLISVLSLISQGRKRLEKYTDILLQKDTIIDESIKNTFNQKP